LRSRRRFRDEGWLPDREGRVVKRYICVYCGFIYDEALGIPEDGIAPGTPWSDIADDWYCPDCGNDKASFEMQEF
jgi:rubredoxin